MGLERGKRKGGSKVKGEILLFIFLLFACLLFGIFLMRLPGIPKVYGFVAAFFLASVVFLSFLLLLVKEPALQTVLPAAKAGERVISPPVTGALPFPYAAMDANAKIAKYNAAFQALFPGKALTGMAGAKLLLGFDLSGGLKQRVTLPVGLFDAYLTKREGNAAPYAVCLVDVSAEEKLLETLSARQTAAGLIFIDNYEEVLESIEDASVPLLTALIDRKLNSMVSSCEGIIKKFERDRYLLLVSEEKLGGIMEKRFEILNEIREINIGEHIPVTLSIGIGAGEISLAAAMKSAKTAIDLALGRGGDQALVKEGEKYLFYGGKSGEVSHNARIRARVKADALLELMNESEQVFVMGHKQADLDCLGASLGVYRIAKSLDKECHIVLDEVSTGIRRLYGRLMEAGGYEDTFLSAADALEKAGSNSVLVIADTHRESLVPSVELLHKVKKVVLFDHHRKSTDAIEGAVLIYHEPYASSTSELITEIIQYLGEKIKLPNLEADALLAGITVDTKNFCVKTGAITFEAAAYLKRNGADSIRVRLLFQEDMEEYKAKAAAVKDAQLLFDHIALSVCPYHPRNTNLTAAQAADELLNLTGVKASFVICETKEKTYISARSFGEINVQLIMEKLGGGGHMTVSGVQFTDVALHDVENRLKRAITEYLQEVG